MTARNKIPVLLRGDKLDAEQVGHEGREPLLG
jgi:hypothetical protein